MLAEDYLKVIVGFAAIYTVVSFLMMWVKPGNFKSWYEAMTPTLFVSIVMMGLTALGYIR